MHHPIDRITHTTAFVTPVVEHWLEREIAQWVHPMKDRSDDPRTMSERSYHGATCHSLLKHDPETNLCVLCQVEILKITLFPVKEQLFLFNIHLPCLIGMRCSSILECLHMV